MQPKLYGMQKTASTGNRREIFFIFDLGAKSLSTCNCRFWMPYRQILLFEL